jgi:hypothetical protein
VLTPIKTVWIVITVIVLGISLYGFDGKPNSDIGVVLAWSMLTLAFPVSLLVALAFTGISLVTEQMVGVISTSYWWIAITWLCFFVAGYWQWFVLLPWLWRKWKGRGTRELKRQT